MCRGHHCSRCHVPDHCENLAIANEVRGDDCCASGVGLVVPGDKTQRRTADSAGVVNFLNRQVDPATRHNSVTLFPWAGGTYCVSVGPALAPCEQQERKRQTC